MLNKNMKLGITVLVALLSIYLLILIMPHLYGFLQIVYNVLLPFLVALILSFILHPLVDKLEKQRINRGVAVFIVFVTLVYFLIYSIISIAPMVTEQLEELTIKLPELIKNFDDIIINITKGVEFEGEPVTTETVAAFVIDNFIAINVIIKNFLGVLYQSLGIVFLTPIITFYLLYDYHNIKRRIRNYLSKKNIDILSDAIEDVEKSIGAYFRGLLFVMVILTVVSSILFAIVGMEYPVLFGLAIGITNIIPIIGPYIGGAFVGAFALTGSISLFISVLVIVLVLQIFESNILTPYIQSKVLKTHPLSILVAFMVFGTIFGFVGMVLSIPLLAIFLITVRYFKLIRKKGNMKSIKRP